MMKGSSSSSSWLTAVKRAFRSPTKDSEKTRNQRRKKQQQHEHEEEEELKVNALVGLSKDLIFKQTGSQDIHLLCQKKEKRGNWLFSRTKQHKENQNQNQNQNNSVHTNGVSEAQKNAIAMAVKAQPEMEVARFAGPSPKYSTAYDYAAVIIQTAFRGYLVSKLNTIILLI